MDNNSYPKKFKSCKDLFNTVQLLFKKPIKATVKEKNITF